MRALKRLLQVASDLAFPKRAVCVGCGSLVGCDVDWLCATCEERLQRRWTGGRADGCPPALVRASAYEYREPVPNVVHALKYASVSQLAGCMAADMARACAALPLSGAPLVVPAPMHPKRLRARGYNQAELLSRAVAEALSLPHADALVKLRDTRQQSRLSNEARAENLRGAVGVRTGAREAIPGRAILLIDDVYTTGATVRACADALSRAGSGPIFVLTFAAARGN